MFIAYRNSMIQLAFPSPRNIKFMWDFLCRKTMYLDFLCLEICRAWLFPHPENPFVSTDGKHPMKFPHYFFGNLDQEIHNFSQWQVHGKILHSHLMVHMHKYSIDNTHLNNFNWARRQLNEWQVTGGNYNKGTKPNTETSLQETQ